MEIIALASLAVGILTLIVALAQLRRTAKLKRDPNPIMPVSTLILGADMASHGRDLPTYSSGITRMGFSRRSAR